MTQRGRPLQPPRRRCHGDEGSALVEWALLMPFVSIAIFGTIDAGRAYSLKNRLTNMAREGAYYAQWNPRAVKQTNSGGTANALCAGKAIGVRLNNEDSAMFSQPGFTWSVTDETLGITLDYCYDASSATVAVGDRIRVDVKCSMTTLTPFLGRAKGSTITLTGSAWAEVQQV